MAPPYAREETFKKLESLIFTVTYVAYNKSKYKAPPYPNVEEFNEE